MSTIGPLVSTMRPGQWVKNLFVLAPAVFAKAHTADDPTLLVLAVLATVVFILLSGSVYIMNDVLDIEKDRLHPVRSRRPLPSGRLSVQSAVAGGLLSLGIGFALGSLLGTAFVVTATLYLVQNVFYSTFLKKIAYLDVLSIATGFLLRILAGCFAIGLAPAEISYYLIICTFLVSLFLALGKRRHELALLKDASKETRSVLGQYRIEHLDFALYTVGTLTTASYAVYTLSDRTLAYFGTWHLVFTLPFVAFGILRFLTLLRRTGEQRSPTDVMVRDVPFVVNIAMWAAVVAGVVYF